MLYYNITDRCKARGIDKPYSFFKSKGFSINTATRLANNRLRQINLKMLESICITLHCTPNDLLEWVPSKSETDIAAHPLYPLKRREKVLHLTQMLNSIPMDKLDEIEQYIQERSKNTGVKE
jgi:DNA-binding Xre family transcriptional regulator